MACHLGHVADLVLAWCSAHPERLGVKEAAAETPGGSLPGSVYESLGDLHTALASSADSPKDIHDGVDELFQRLEDSGYEWRTTCVRHALSGRDRKRISRPTHRSGPASRCVPAARRSWYGGGSQKAKSAACDRRAGKKGQVNVFGPRHTKKSRRLAEKSSRTLGAGRPMNGYVWGGNLGSMVS